MAGVKDIKMKPKLLGALLIAGLIPLAIIAFLSLERAKEGMMKQAFNLLDAVQMIKLGQIQTFFGERVGDAIVLADNPYTKMAVVEMEKASTAARARGLSGSGLMQDPTYKAAFDLYHPTFKKYMETYGYYDVFLISPDAGDVYYTVCQEADYGTQLSRENTHLASTWKKVMSTGSTSLSDMEPYSPSAGAPAMFVAAPIVDGGRTIGVLALQISNKTINKIMQERSGMGITGETYLVGPDKKMRSDSFLDPNGHSVAASFKGTVQQNGVDTEATREGLAGREGSRVITDYNGNPVLSVFEGFDLPGGTTWVAIAEVDLAEVEAPINAIRNSILWIAIIIAIVVGLIAFYLAASIANPIQKITELAKLISKGDLNQQVVIEQGDEVGQLADAFGEMGDSLRAKAATATEIAKGNLSIEVAVVSPQDTLGNAMVDMINSLKTMNAEVRKLAEAAVAGKLDARGDTSQLEGDYAQLVHGINETLNSMAKPINEASDVLERIAEWDMTVRMKGDYRGDFAKIKTSINTAVENLDKNLAQVGTSAEQVTAAAGQISSGSQGLAEGASEQASSLEEISSSLEEMASMTRQNADNSSQAKALSQTARDFADNGTNAMRRMTETIGKIKTSSVETSKIVGTINEIAFQTNLLALNAAVEAARAGEVGKGFAVVAEEVRNLARRSAEAAKTTASLIEESLKNSESGVMVTEEVAEILGEIAEGSRKVNDLVNEIAAASAEQSQGIEQVNTAVSELDKVTQQNAANAEESASAAEELNSQATELQGMVREFKLTDVQRQTVESFQVKPLTHKSGLHKEIHHMTQPKSKAVGHLNGNGNGSSKRGKKPEELIPLDEDMEGLEDF